MLAHFSQLGSGAPGTGSLPQGLLLQVLLQLRLPQEKFGHIICKAKRDDQWKQETVRVLENTPQGPQDPYAPRFQAPGQALLGPYNLRLGLCEGLLLSKEHGSSVGSSTCLSLPHIYRLQKDGYILKWTFKFRRKVLQ